MSQLSLRFVVERAIPLGIAGLVVVAAVVGRSASPLDPVPVASTEHVVRPVEGDPAASRARRQPDAVFAGELVSPWSTIRTTIAGARPDDEDSLVLVDELRDAVDALRRARRDPARAIPLSDTLATLGQLETQLTLHPRWSQDPAVTRSLAHHHEVLARFARAR